VNLCASSLASTALLKKSMSFTDELFCYTQHALLSAPVAITQNAFLARSLRAGNSNLWSRNHWRMSLHPFTTSSMQALIFLPMSLSHALDQNPP